MNKDLIDVYLDDIKKEAKKMDDEIAHRLEKELWEKVLIQIALGIDNPEELAAKALESRSIEFSRWFS